MRGLTRFLRLCGRGAFRPIAAVVAAGLSVGSADAQDAGMLRAGGESYHDTAPGESVNGVTLDFRQLLRFGGVASGEVIFVDRKDQSALGRGVFRVTELPLGPFRAAAEAGDFTQKLDASPYHFANDFWPVAYLRGGAVRAETSTVSLSLFEGRNEQFRGIRLPTVTFAPESLAGATLAVRAGEALVLDANALATSNHHAAANPLFGAEVPASAQAYGIGGTLRLAEFWTAQVRSSYARYEYAPSSSSANGHFLSFVAGSVLDAPRWKVEGNYLREGVNYVPLSTASVGNREGPHLLVQSLGERLTATASFSSYRNNLERTPGLPDLRSQSLLLAGSWRLTNRLMTNWSVSEQSLSSRRDGDTSRFTQRTASSSLSLPTVGFTRLRYQYQTTDQPTLQQRLHEIELEQQPPPVHGLQLVAAIRLQHATDGASSLLYRGGLTGSIGDVRLAVSGEWGRDLAGSTIFALNRNQTMTAAVTVPLPAEIELRVEGYWNRVAAVVNPESIFVSQTTQEELFSINRRSLLVRLVRSFRWGREPANSHGISPAFGVLPYGAVEGVVFQDRNGNGVRDPGEPPVPGIVVLLDNGQALRSDATGRFVFRNVVEGTHSVALDMEVLPVSYNSPRDGSAQVQVQRLQPGRHDFPLVPTSKISGRVEQQTAAGDRIPFPQAIVTLLPGEFSTYTDAEGRFSFANLPPGRYTVRLEEASLPDGAVVDAGHSDEQTLSGGDDLLLEPFVFRLPVEEKPVQKIFEREQTVQPPASRPKPEPGGSSSSGKRSHERTR